MPSGRLDTYYKTMRISGKKDKIINSLRQEINIYRNYILLLNGKQALDRIDRQIMIERTDKMLSITDTNTFNETLENYAER